MTWHSFIQPASRETVMLHLSRTPPMHWMHQSATYFAVNSFLLLWLKNDFIFERKTKLKSNCIKMHFFYSQLHFVPFLFLCVGFLFPFVINYAPFLTFRFLLFCIILKYFGIYEVRKGGNSTLYFCYYKFTTLYIWNISGELFNFDFHRIFYI